MRIWIALIVAPLLALTDLTVSFATVGFACAHQAPVYIHLVHLLFLAAAAACAYGAMQGWLASGQGSAEPRAQARFLTSLAMASAALSTVAIAAMWAPVWIVPSCLS